jgi:hypothetical protein
MRDRLSLGKSLVLGVLVSIPSWLLGFLWVWQVSIANAGAGKTLLRGYLFEETALGAFSVFGGLASIVVAKRWSSSPWWLRALPGLTAGAVGTGIFWEVVVKRGAFLDTWPRNLVSLVTIHLLPPLNLFPPLFLVIMGSAGGFVAWTVLKPLVPPSKSAEGATRAGLA